MSSTNNSMKANATITFTASIATSIAITMSSTIVQAGTIRHDRSDWDYRNLAGSFPSVGYFSAKNSRDAWGCSGTLIGSKYVLTAAHCVEYNNTFLESGTFSVGTGKYSVSALATHSLWNSGNPSAGNDIAVLQLTKPVFGIQPATLFSGFNEDSKVGTYVGFGKTGNGLTGQYLESGTKRAGQNIINVGSKYGASNNLLLSDFSVPTSVDLFEVKNIGGKCLDVQWGNISNRGTSTWLWDCNGTNAQKWYKDGSQIKNIGGKALDVQWGLTFLPGTPVQIWDSNGTNAQQWSSPSFSSYAPIQNVGGKCLDVQWGLTWKSATPIQIWNCNGTNAQKWKAYYQGGYDYDYRSPALNLEYQLGSGDSGGGLFIDGKVAGVHSFISGYKDGKYDATYTDTSASTRVSYFQGFIEAAKKALANLGIASAFSSSSKSSSGFGSGGGSWTHAPLAPEFNYFDESFEVSIIDDTDFEYLLSLNDNPVLEPSDPERVPEPGTTFSVIFFGVSAALTLKRKRQNQSHQKDLH